MELKEFVKVTLSDVASAIKESQEDLQHLGCIVNPPLLGDRVEWINGIAPVYSIEFNLAIAAEEKEVNKAGIGIVQVVKAGISNENSGSTSSNTNLKFNIKVVWPIHSMERYNEIASISNEN